MSPYGIVVLQGIITPRDISLWGIIILQDIVILWDVITLWGIITLGVLSPHVSATLCLLPPCYPCLLCLLGDRNPFCLFYLLGDTSIFWLLGDKITFTCLGTGPPST